MNFAKAFLSMALAAIVALTLNSTTLLAQQATVPCANGATIAQNDSYSNGIFLGWKHHFEASDGSTARSDSYYNGPALTWVHDYNSAYHRDPVPCVGMLGVQLQFPAPASAPANPQKGQPPTHLTATLSLSREDREKFNAVIDELRAQDVNVAAALAKLENNNGDVREILAAIKSGFANSHDDTTVAALDKLSDTLAGMMRESSNTQVRLINALAGGIGELNKTQTQLLTVEQKRLELEKKLVFWTRWDALADTASAMAQWGQFALAATGHYSASAAASASAVAMKAAGASLPEVTF